ncbi:MAG: PKD domain-containing protein [Flavobacterium sp.]
MKKIILFFILWMASVANLNAQSPPCASDLIMNNLIQNNPEIKKRVDLMNRQIGSMKDVSRKNISSGSMITIPVVVYVVHTNQSIGVGSNISDAQVNSQLTALNTYFSPSGIKFCLATKTYDSPTLPLRNTSDVQNVPGIIHVNNTTLSNNQSNNPQALLASAHYSIGRDNYLRIWVVNSIDGASTGAGILGYSTFPYLSYDFDGIVIRRDVFGDASSANMLPNYNLGKVLVHEMGHYFGLYHTFEGGCSAPNSDCLSDGDHVCDTPPEAAPNYGCTPANTCSEIPNNPDDIHNYMAYGDNNCANHFTAGQNTRMYNTITTFRSELISTDNQINTGTCGYGNLVSATFTPTKYTTCTNSAVTFNPPIISGATYSWDFGDGGTSSLQTPSHTYISSTGSPYTVTLTVTAVISGQTVSDTSTAQIFVTNCSPINNTDSNWYTGYSNMLSFSSGIPVFNPTFPETSVSYAIYTSAVQSNSSGNLLFYTNKYKVFNNNQTTATPITTTNLIADNPELPTDYSVLSLPKPGSTTQYYIFTNTYNTSSSPAYTDNGFHYSIVNVSGTTASMGAIRQPVTTPAGYLTNASDGAVIGGEGITAMANCNTGGYWIFTTLKKGTSYYLVVYSFTSTGLTFNSEYQITSYNIGKNVIKVSPNGDRIFIYTPIVLGEGYLFDFNKITGQISRPVTINASPATLWGSSFSPDSKLLYVNVSQAKIFQYDLNSYDINNTKMLVGTVSPGKYMGHLQLGPDNKIYIDGNLTNEMRVIHKPNSMASVSNPNACLFSIHGPKKSSPSMPYFTTGLPNIVDAKQPTAYPATASSISSYVVSCKTYKFFPDFCGTSFNWNFGDTVSNTSTDANPTHTFSNPGTYTVTLRNSSNVVIATTTVVVTGIASPTIYGNTSICPAGYGGTRITNNSINLAPGQTVVWTTSASGAIVGPNNQTSVEVNWTTPGTLTATITGDSGCTAASSITITEDSATATISTDNFCFSTSDYSTAHSTTIPPGYTAEWSFENGIEGTFTTPTNQANVGVTWETGTSFGYLGLKLTNPNGCAFYGSKTVYDQCVCNCFNTRTYSYTISGLKVTFTVGNSNSACAGTSNGGTRYSYGDGTYGYSPIHTYAAPGTYTVTIRGVIIGAYDETICSGTLYTTTVTVTNCKGCSLGKQSLDNLSIYPNPASSMLNLDVTFNAAAPLEVVLKTVDGKEILRKQWKVAAGQQNIMLELPSNISDGMVFVELISDEIRETRTVLIKK